MDRLIAAPVILPVALCGLLAACSGEPGGLPAHELTATLETERVAGTGDAADDPAVWVAPDPSQSLVLGTDKTAGLYAYELDGTVAAYIDAGRVNNVDVRYDFALPGPQRDIAVASDRTNIGLAVFLIDPETRAIEHWPTIPVADIADPYGACLYRSPIDGAFYAFLTDKEPGTVVQLLLRYDGEGVISGDEVRRFATGSTTEGCVADDRTGLVYIAEENEAVWVIGAEPDDGGVLRRFADVDGQQITADAEGVAILPEGATGGWLMVSSQGDSAYALFELESGAFAGRVRIAEGATDAVSGTDGIEISARGLGDAFPGGVFLAQDDAEDSGGQNFKLVDLDRVREAIAAGPAALEE